MSDRATAISLRACSTRAAAARRSWFAPIASSTSFLSAGSLKTVHHGKSASDAGSGGPCWPLVTSGVATVGRLYSGPSAQAANSGSAAKIARSPVALLLTAGSPAQQHVEYRRQEQAEQRDAEHAAEDRGPQGLAHLGPGAGGDRQRQHAENERERGHHDGPQPQPAGFDRGGEFVHAALLLLLGELDDQDGVLGREADQDDEADLRDEVVVHATEPRAEERERQTHRRDQDDGQRQRPALILGGMDEKDEEHAKRKDEDRGVAGELRLIGEVRPFDLHPGREHPGGETLHRRRRRAQAAARRRVAVHL